MINDQGKVNCHPDYITVVLHASLKDRVIDTSVTKDSSKNNTYYLPCTSQFHLNECLQQLGICREKVNIVVINGKQTQLDTIIKAGDKVELFPALGGG